MDPVWTTCPWPTLRLHAAPGGLAFDLNEAARRWGAEAGVSAADWQGLAHEQWAQPELHAGPVPLGPHAVHCVPVADGEGRVLWLQPAAVPAAAEDLTQAQEAAQVLERALVLAGVSVWRLDLQTKRLHFNSVGMQSFNAGSASDGIPVEQVRNSIHPQDLAAMRRGSDEAVARQGVVDVRVRYRNRDGSWRTLLTRRVAERDAQGRAVALAGISLNVSAQRAEQDRAEALAEHARLVAEVMGIGLWSRDVENDVVRWDKQMHAIHRRDPALPPPGARDWAEVCVHSQDRAWVNERLRRDGERWAPMTEMTFRSLDDPGEGTGEAGAAAATAPARERWVQAWVRRVERDGRRMLFGIHMDVSERKRAGLSLGRERARTRFALDAAAVGVCERDASGKFVYWSDAMYRQRGLEPSDPRSPDELATTFTDPGDLVQLATLFRRHVDHNEPYRMELRVPLAGAGERWVLTQGHALHDTEGRLLSVIGVHVDITERKRAEALRHEKERVERAMRDKSDFMTRMSHELRTPMNAVLGFTRLLQEDPLEPTSARQRERLAHIADAATVLLGMVDDVLNVARNDGPAPPAVTAPATPAQKPLDVLCIEDNPVNLQLVRELMALRPAVRLQTAVDGHSGIAAARRTPPRLLLLDLHLPDLHGIDVLRELKADPALSNCLFVALSADAMPEHIEAARAAGFDDYWTKPIDFDRFLADIDRIAARV